jgi:hypothetical protein
MTIAEMRVATNEHDFIVEGLWTPPALLRWIGFREKWLPVCYDGVNSCAFGGDTPKPFETRQDAEDFIRETLASWARKKKAYRPA